MSSLLWTTIAAILYIEIAIVLLMLLPIIPASRWKQLFSSGALRWISEHATLYVRTTMVILVVVFLEAIRETFKYSNMHNEAEKTLSHHGVDTTSISIRMFRAQRNLYISGFAMFTFFILNRLVKLINQQARIEAVSAASMAQARSASEAAKQLMDAATPSGKSIGKAKEYDKEIAELKAAIAKGEKELETVRARSVDVSEEYGHLRDEHEKLRKEVARAQH